MNLLFKPFGIISGLIAGRIGEKLFNRLWALFDSDDPPAPEDRDASHLKLLLALAVQGAIFTAVRGVVEHGARHGYEAMTGDWPA